MQRTNKTKLHDIYWQRKENKKGKKPHKTNGKSE